MQYEKYKCTRLERESNITGRRRTKIYTNGGRRTAAGDDEGGADRPGEKRERKRREEKETDNGLSFSLVDSVAPSALTRLTHDTVNRLGHVDTRSLDCPMNHISTNIVTLL
jgi:hypothetical protein